MLLSNSEVMTGYFSLLLIIFPPTRKLLIKKLSKKYPAKNNKKQDFINGEFEDIDDDNDKKI